MAPGQLGSDLGVPVGTGREVGAGHKAPDPATQALERPLNRLRQGVVVMLVADEYLKLIA